MGINIHGARALCFAKRLGADYSTTATIARQGMALSERDLAGVLEKFGYGAAPAEVRHQLSTGYTEELLRHLGAKEVHSFDVSPYEGATYIHDMNAQLPDEHKERYSVVLDSGSLEHIFNVPTAIRNCMEMLRVGGHYVAILPANNFCGHGFYQFSPEFFFNIFGAANGFEVTSMVAFNDRPNKSWRAAAPNATWYEVRNPLELRERVTLANADPISLIVVAKRTAKTPIFAATPQQSDYAAMWRASQEGHAAEEPALTVATPRPLSIRIAKALIPASLRLALRKATVHRPKPLADGFKARFFRPIDPTSVRGRGKRC